MKTPRFLLLVLAAMLAMLAPRQAQARLETSFDFFYDSLSPYGEWVQVADYGTCWRPTNVDPDWAPYSDGYWAYTDAGWTWVSYEEFGGIVYHYGRWTRVEDEGWCWVPEYEWGPAWVSWRNSDDYVGWAPLPPEARWQPEIGFSVWCDRDYDIGPGYYSFCRVRDFGAPVLRPVIINRFENVKIIRHTVNITNMSYNNHYNGGAIIFNGGPNFAVINKRSARPIPALKLVQNANIDLGGLRDGEHRRNFNGQAVGNQLIVTAPFVKPPADPALFKTKATKVFTADKVTHGWNGVKDEGVRRELKDELQRQTKGLTRETAPAKAVAAADLKVLPAKADPQAPSPVAERERPDKKGRMSEASGPAAGQNDGNGGQPKSGPTAVVPQNPDEKPNKQNGRGPLRDSQKPVSGDPNLKPFNPAVTETDPNPRKGKNGGVPNSNPEPGQPGQPDVTGTDDSPRKGKNGGIPNSDSGNAARQADIMRQRQEAQAAVKQQQQMDAQRQADLLRKQQLQQQPQEGKAKGRPQGDGQPAQPNNQADNFRRQQQMQQQQQQQQQQNAQQASEKQQRSQQMQQQANESRKAAQENQRPPQPQSRTGPPPGAGSGGSPTPTDGHKKKDKDKDNQ